MKEIAVVIPSKDEENTIDRCIESVQAGLKDVRNCEIILVDSYSTDKTIEIARKYPIKILRLKKKWPKSPHAGRYIGTINSNSEYVFFLDADMAVDENWIKKGLKLLKEDRTLAGITGVIFNILPNEKINNKRPSSHPIGNVSYLPGPAIYRSSVLAEVNHFNPFLRGYGEREIGYRISEKGLRQLRINSTISYHFAKERDLKEVKEKAGYFTGVGQFLKLHFNLNNLIETVTKYPLIFLLCAFISMYLFSTILSIILEKAILFEIPTAFMLILFLILAGKQRNLKKTCLFILALLSSLINLISGFLKKIKSRDEYPTDVETIK